MSYAIRDQASLLLGQTLYQHQSALPYMGSCNLSSCSSTKRPMILGRPTVQKTKAQICIVDDVVVGAVYVVVDDFELLQRRSPAGQLKLHYYSILTTVLTNIGLSERGIRGEMKFSFCAEQFLELLSSLHLLFPRTITMISLKIFKFVPTWEYNWE